MPVFNAHIPAGRFSPEQKRALVDALNQSLVQGLGIPTPLLAAAYAHLSVYQRRIAG